MNRMAELTGKDAMETLQLLEGSSPESRGILNRKDPMLDKMYKLLSKSENAMQLLQHKDAAWALDCLLHMPNELGEVMRDVRLKYGWRLAGGYDLVVPALIETPDFYLKTIYLGSQEDPLLAEKSEEKVRKLADEWKAAIPEDKREEFEEILDVGQRFFRMRDERGLATDLTGIGLCRRGILEAGRRLADQGVILKAHHLCCASKDEALSLLRGDFGHLTGGSKRMGPVEIPTPRELERRFKYIETADPNLIPRALGTPPPIPDYKALPPQIRRTMGAINTSLLRGVWDERQEDVDESITKSADKVKGVAASMGIISGPICLVLKDGDLRKVKKGDIVCTYSCSASFNIVVGLCAGIVTDYGGMLSHAAIVAREYGVPAIVGSQHATSKFKDGDIVEIDSSSATVTLIDRII
jgi:phosphohistidine swiveling domain-containing protein